MLVPGGGQQALACMHEDSAVLVHRDVKPANIMAVAPRAATAAGSLGARSRSTQWKLVDFGTAVAVAVAARQERGPSTHAASTLQVRLALYNTTPSLQIVPSITLKFACRGIGSAQQ